MCSAGKCEKCNEAAKLLQEWTDKQGHDRCWYYPDIFCRLCEIYGIMPGEVKLPPLDEFKGGCERYQKEEFEPLEPRRL